MKSKDGESKEFRGPFNLDRRSLLRSSVLMGGALAAHALSGDAPFAAAESNAPVATTKAGAVRGRLESGINVFKGIPYGAPPTGPLRFMPPVQPAPWTGVRDALEFGDQCPQVPPPPTPEWRSWAIQRERRLFGFECLDTQLARWAQAASNGLVSRRRLLRLQRLRCGL
jgi:hypothetical protein